MLIMELKMILIVIMETLDFSDIYSRFDEYLTLQFKQTMNLIVCYFVIFQGFMLSVYVRANFLQALMVPESWETMDKLTHWLL